MVQDHVKIVFNLEQDEDGYPPYAVETLWAVPVREGYRIDNIPFYVRGIAWGDVVSAVEDDGNLVYEALIEESGHSTLRLVVYEPAKVENLRNALHEKGCSTELSDNSNLIAVDVPNEIDYGTIVAFLEKGLDDWDYEEGAIGH